MRLQPDRRLVEDVGDVGQRRPERADHLRALRLAARQRPGRATERQVFQPDIAQEGQPLDDFLENRLADVGVDRARLAPPDRNLLEELHCVVDGQFGDVADAAARHHHRKRLSTQALAMADGARLLQHVPGEVLAHRVAARLAIAPRQVGQDAFQIALDFAPATAIGGVAKLFSRRPGERTLRAAAGRSPHGAARSNLNVRASVGSTTFRR